MKEFYNLGARTKRASGLFVGSLNNHLNEKVLLISQNTFKLIHARR